MKIFEKIILLIGLGLVFLSFLMNLKFIGKILTQDGVVDNVLIINYFWLFKLLLFFTGLLFLFNKIYLDKLKLSLINKKKEIIFAGIIIVFCLVLIEISSFFIVKYYFTHLAFRDSVLSYSNVDFNITASFNHFGFRDEEFNLEKEYRIAIVGDSYVFGAGVEKNKTFETIVEQTLNEFNGEKNKTAVYNLGVPGKEPLDYLDVIKEMFPVLKPNLTIITLYLGNDITCKNGFFSEMPFHNILFILKNKFIDHSVDAEIKNIIENSSLKNKYKNYLKKDTVNPTLVMQAISHPNISESLEITKNWLKYCSTKKTILKIKETVQKYNSKIIILMIPPPYQVSSANWETINDLGYMTDLSLLDDRELQDSLISFCNEKKMDCIDLLPYLKNSSSFPYFNLDPHFNQVGHNITAEIIINHLRSSNQW